VLQGLFVIKMCRSNSEGKFWYTAKSQRWGRWNGWVDIQEHDKIGNDFNEGIRRKVGETHVKER